MTIEFLDHLTMWMAFTYGAVMYFVLEVPFVKAAESRRPDLFLILRRHQPLALVCLWVGALWIAQDTLLRF